LSRRLVVFSDPGGAKPCLTLAKKWLERDDVLVCSDRHYSFFDYFGIPVRACNGNDAGHVFDGFMPDSLFTGTSYTSRIELDFLAEAGRRGVPSVAFVDHYTGFRERFIADGAIVLPDEIHCVDEEAARLAAEQGLPHQSIRVTGNPYHGFLRNWRTAIPKDSLWQRLGLPPSDAKSVLFAPDPLSNAGGVPKFGTDETAILALLLDALARVEKSFQLLVKTHPNQDPRRLESALDFCPPNVEPFLIGSENDFLLNDLVQHADLVTGMFSNLLVEAHILGARTLRILCGLTINDPLRELRDERPVVTKEDLFDRLCREFA
jgi:hypothetical protein